MHPYKKIVFKLLFCFVIGILAILNITAQPCNGSWAFQLPLTVECVSGQWIGWQNGPANPPGCPTTPVYVGVQSNTFTFTQLVSTFSIDFRDFDGTIQCPRMEIKINGIFYPLTIANLIDIPPPSTCTGSFSRLAITPDGYITIGSFSPATGQGRIIIYNVSATSVTVSTNDGNGTIFSNPFNCTTVPLKLERFTCRNNGCKALLIWKTGIEQNVKVIEIQRSEEGIIFNNVGETLPKGSNSNYSFITDNYSDAYFRLKIIDLDGSYNYSEILHIKSSCNKSSYQVRPNPAENQIEISSLIKDDWIWISEMTGRVVIKYSSLQNNIFNVQNLASGMYIIQVVNKESVKATLKFIKK